MFEVDTKYVGAGLMLLIAIFFFIVQHFMLEEWHDRNGK